MSGITDRIARIVASQFRMRSWDAIGECEKDEYRAVVLPTNRRAIVWEAQP